VKKILLTALTLALVIAGATIVFAAGGHPGTAGVTSSGPNADSRADQHGRSDDARRADEMRGRGRDHAEDRPGEVEDDRGELQDEPGEVEDVPGPCDEAEHASDPRCAGGAPVAGPVDDDQPDEGAGVAVDNSGPGSVNSGPGSVNSGRDDVAEGGDEGGNSGPGGGESGDDD